MNDNKQKPIWKPSEKLVENANITRFIEFVNKRCDKNLTAFDDLYDWSITDIESFWDTLREFANIKFSEKWTSRLNWRDKRSILGAKWFPGAKLNFAENLLRYDDDRVAVKAVDESGTVVEYSYRELRREVAKCAAALKRFGVGKADRVAAYVSATAESIIAMLATTSLGAIWSSTSPDFGATGALDRFGQIQPKVLFAVDGYRYNGKVYDRRDALAAILDNIPEIRKAIVLPKTGSKKIKSDKIIYWDDALDSGAEEIEFEQTEFDHPVYIMYSSGTTGKPKRITHGAGGTLLQHFKELSLHTDVKRDDVVFYFTTCGWMMWNWLASTLQLGATVFLFDGSPSHPDLNALWKAAQDHKISVFGTSPKFLSACEKAGVNPGGDFDLSSLKTILSTGAPLLANSYEWVYKFVKRDVLLSSISGGTDIISCFMLGCPTLPVYPEEIQCRGLGMKVEAYDENGASIIDEKGELVCTAPFPSMPVYFWDDYNKSKYKKAYFNYYPGVWRHGDYIRITERGGVVVYGRSDSTLNPGGVRIGSAEIYRVVEAMDEISNSLVVGVSKSGDVRIALFVVLRDGGELDEILSGKIKNEIREKLTPRHVPGYIKQISEVPETLNGKKVEIAVRNILEGEKVTNRSALANPGSLKQFENMKLD